MSQVVLAWLLGRPGVTGLVFGARTEEQLRDDLTAVDLVLTKEEIRRIDEVGQPQALYPSWHRAMSRPIVPTRPRRHTSTRTPPLSRA